MYHSYNLETYQWSLFADKQDATGKACKFTHLTNAFIIYIKKDDDNYLEINDADTKNQYRINTPGSKLNAIPNVMTMTEEGSIYLLTNNNLLCYEQTDQQQYQGKKGYKNSQNPWHTDIEKLLVCKVISQWP